MNRFYEPELARVHAEGFASKMAPAFPWLLARIRSTARNPHLWDLGCGDGGWLAFARDRGLPVEGVDRSPAFVNMCQRKGLSVRCADAAQASVPDGVTAVTALGEVLCYEPAALWPVAERLAGKLPRGAGFWFDLIGTHIQPTFGRMEQNDWCIESNVEVTEHTLCRHITLQTCGETFTEVHRQRIFSAEEVLEKFAQQGFHARILSRYGEMPLLPGRFAVEARLL